MKYEWRKTNETDEESGEPIYSLDGGGNKGLMFCKGFYLHVADELNRLAALIPMWQTIETASKEGRQFS